MDYQGIIKYLRELNVDTHVAMRANHVVDVEIIALKMGSYFPNINMTCLSIAALAHDMFKDLIIGTLPKDQITETIISSDDRRYVRSNLDVLEKFNLDYYFNSDAGYHALAAGILLHKEFGIDSPEILYPVFMHSCPIISVYDKLPDDIKNHCNIISLADKISKNQRMKDKSNNKNKTKKKSNVYKEYDLEQIVFGPSGHELNITSGLFMVRYLESNSNTDGVEAKKAFNYFYDKAREINPLLPKKYPTAFSR